MTNRHLVLCGGASPTRPPTGWKDAHRLPLAMGDDRNDVHFKIRHLASRASAALSAESLDLLDIAAYVYCADQAVSRGGTKEFDYGERWNRHFRFEIPVRRPEVWRSPRIHRVLVATLGFLTDDEYEFGFCSYPHAPTTENYLYERLAATDDGGFEEVMLFSGGLDSLAGAIQEVLVGRRRVALVSHRPENRVYSRQCDLVNAIRQRCRAGAPRPIHVPVEANKGERLTRDYTQRSRSFLFAAVAAVTARFLGLKRIRFYENGVTGMNLPMNPQIVGARASRTTHPRVLAGFKRLLSELFVEPFDVNNPFQWKTKAQVLREIRAAGHADLCAMTCSCANARNRPKQSPHCGGCSQCLDRRIAALAAGLSDAEDAPAGYETDVLVSPRDGTERVLFESYARFARELDRLTDVREFLTRYPGATTELMQFGIPQQEAAEALFRLHKQHATDVIAGFAAGAAGRIEGLVAGRYHPASLLGMIAAQTGGVPTLPTISQAANGRLTGQPRADEATLSLWFDGRRHSLGPTLEFRLIHYLCERFDKEVPLDDIREDVWKDDQTEANAIQRVASNLRRIFKRVRIRGLVIVGQKGYYRLTWSARRRQRNVSAPSEGHQG